MKKHNAKPLTLLLTILALLCALSLCCTAAASETPSEDPGWESEHVHTPGEPVIAFRNRGGTIVDQYRTQDIYCSECGEWLEWEQVTEKTASNPVVSLTAVPKRDLVEYLDSYETTHEYWEDDVLVRSDSYQYYNVDGDVLDLTVTLKDGSVFSGSWYSICAEWENLYGEEDYEWNVESDQDENHWGPGKHTVTISICGKAKTTVTVNVIKNPVASVTAKQISPVIENLDGYKTSDSEGKSFFYYDYQDAFTYTVTFNDGREPLSGDRDFFYETEYYLSFYEDQYSNPWGTGDHTVEVDYMGKAFPITVKISESPVKSITVSNVRPVSEVRDTRMARNYVYDDNTGEETYTTFYAFNFGAVCFDFKVAYKDGSSKTFTYFAEGEYDGYEVEPENGDKYAIPADRDTLRFSYLGVPFEVKIPFDEKRPANPQFCYYVQDGKAYITQYLGKDKNLVIPATVDGIPVAGVISLSNFSGYEESNVESITVSDGIRSLSDSAFGGLEMLHTIHLGADVANVSPNFLRGCYGLKTVTVSEKNPNYKAVDGILYDKNVTQIVAVPYGNLLDEKTNDPKTYTIPATVSDISVLIDLPYFSRDVALAAGNPYFTMEDGVLYNKDKTVIYRVDRKKAGAYEMPDSVNTICSSAFSDCQELQSVKISPNVTEIVYGAFADCKKLTSIEIPASVKSVGNSAFAFSGVKEITLKNENTVVSQNAFSGCPAETLRAGNQVQTLYPPLVVDDANKTLRIPSTVTEITYYYSQPKQYADYTLTSIADSVKYISSDTIANYKLKDVENNAAYVGNALIQCVDKNKTAPIQVRAGTRIIAENAFSGSKATAVSLPDSLRIINPYAFAGVPLTTLTLPEGLKKIGYYAFAGTKITEIKIPASVTEIDHAAFLGAPLTKITVDPANPAFVMQDGILYSKDMQKVIYCLPSKSGEVTLPASVREIEYCAFNDVEGITVFYLTDRCSSVNVSELIRKETVLSNSQGDLEFRYDLKKTIPITMVERFSASERLAKEYGVPYDFYVNKTITVIDSENVLLSGDNAVRAVSGVTAADILACSDAAYITDAKGNKINETAKVGTGMKLVKTKDGKVIDTTEIVVPGDVDGDADLKSSDARLALRRAVGLETYNVDSAQFKACNVDGGEIQAADARLILRAAVSLENAAEWVRH